MTRGPDILALQNSLGKTMSGYSQHSATDLLRSQNVIRKGPPKHGQQGFGKGVEDAIGGCLGSCSMQGLDHAGSEHVRPRK